MRGRAGTYTAEFALMVGELMGAQFFEDSEEPASSQPGVWRERSVVGKVSVGCNGSVCCVLKPHPAPSSLMIKSVVSAPAPADQHLLIRLHTPIDLSPGLDIYLLAQCLTQLTN